MDSEGAPLAAPLAAGAPVAVAHDRRRRQRGSTHRSDTAASSCRACAATDEPRCAEARQVTLLVTVVLRDRATDSERQGCCGKATLKVVRWLGVLSTAMLPPCASVILRQIHNPRPKPP